MAARAGAASETSSRLRAKPTSFFVPSCLCVSPSQAGHTHHQAIEPLSYDDPTSYPPTMISAPKSRVAPMTRACRASVALPPRPRRVARENTARASTVSTFAPA